MVTSDYIQIISTVIYASALGISMISFWEVRRNTRVQTEQQLYMNILSSSYSLWNNETISKIAKESPEVSSYLGLVDSPEEYNNISAIIGGKRTPIQTLCRLPPGSDILRIL